MAYRTVGVFCGLRAVRNLDTGGYQFDRRQSLLLDNTF